MLGDVHDLAGAYALDGVVPEERWAFEDHLQACDGCSEKVRQFHSTTLELAAAVAAVPPAALRERILSEFANTRRQASSFPVHTQRRPLRALPLFVAAAAVVTVVLGAGLAIQDLAAERDQARDLASVFTAPDGQFTTLNGTPRSTLRVFWSPGLNAVVVVGVGVPAPAEDRVYELWALSDDGPRSAGVFEPEPDGRITRPLPLPTEPVQGWRVTVEPEDGSPEPTRNVAYETGT